ncbi:hypothetical protein GXM_06175 [Nostoc sphaeroides CCNUC1]|uniref:Uncharacterized protein n=1 Tax=Nostoc sphaeroides CCNUC1 TaxID=2653204 RepID=A0A5P8W812_9NOSO|nr:hypothetical protein GXM_06175 [Nostoc sphaeroides CCNUC1]
MGKDAMNRVSTNGLFVALFFEISIIIYLKLVELFCNIHFGSFDPYFFKLCEKSG